MLEKSDACLAPEDSAQNITGMVSLGVALTRDITGGSGDKAGIVVRRVVPAGRPKPPSQL